MCLLVLFLHCIQNDLQFKLNLNSKEKKILFFSNESINFKISWFDKHFVSAHTYIHILICLSGQIVNRKIICSQEKSEQTNIACLISLIFRICVCVSIGELL